MDYVWAADETVKVAVDTGAWHAITSASLVVQLTLLLLVVMSVVSWAIILQKRKQFQILEKSNPPFEEAFFRAGSLEEVFENLRDYPNSNLAAVFRAGFLEMRKIADFSKKSDTPLLSGIDNLQRALNKAIDIEVARLEGRLSFLATVGSVGPFIGLFGTVWGIMGSFQKIGQTGMASLAVVAPGIAEALIATGIGLFAAIPATIGYNFYVSRIRKQESQLNNFVADFLNIAKRNFFRGV